MNVDTFTGVMFGILKYTSFGTLLLTKVSDSVISVSNVILLLLPTISEIEENTHSILKQYLQTMYIVRDLY